MGSFTNSLLNLNAAQIEGNCDPSSWINKIKVMNGRPTVLHHHKLHNKYLLGSFLIKKIELRNAFTMTVVHSTAEENLASIEASNLDWRRVTRAKYGIGVSFSENVDYANYHSSFGGGDRKVYIIVKVLCKHYMIVSDNQNTYAPAPYDTFRSKNGYVWVKFDDFTFYPAYAIHYLKPRRETSAFYHTQFRRY